MTYESHLAFYESPLQLKVRVFPLADSLPMPKSGEFHREENQFTLTVKIIQRSKCKKYGPKLPSTMVESRLGPGAANCE